MLEIMVDVENLYLTDPQFGNPELEEIIKSLSLQKKAKRSRSNTCLLFFYK